MDDIKCTYDEDAYLLCEHCGDVAIVSDDGRFHEEMEGPCLSCGLRGAVRIHTENTDDGGEVDVPEWEGCGPPETCTDPDCRECAELREKAAQGKAQGGQ